MFQWLRQKKAPAIAEPQADTDHQPHLDHSHHMSRRLPPLPLREDAAPIDPAPAHANLHVHHKALNELRAHIEQAARKQTPPAHANASSSIPASVLRKRATSDFFCSNGQRYTSLADLATALVTMDAATFNHHVTAERNDFAAWTAGCIDVTAANAIRGKDQQALTKLFVHSRGGELAARQPEKIIRPQPLPASPLAHDAVDDLILELGTIRANAGRDVHDAREQFIRVRTRVWQELGDDERKKVLPALRETYEALLVHEHHKS